MTGLRRRGLAVIGAAALVVGLSIPPAAAAPLEALQSVSVQVGPDGALTSMSVTTAVRGEDAVTGEQVTLDPRSDGARLPVRVTTAWRMGDEAGTDLAALRGRSGRVVIDLTVENLTVRPEEVSVEDAGAKYRGISLVGVPFTVVAATRLPESALPNVITAGDGSRVTNGVASRTSSGETVVQWAALLAPPMVAPVTTFRLAMDVADFQPPEFDLTVHPGMAVDSTLRDALNGPSGSLARALRHDEETIRTVLDVMDQVQDGQDLVERLSKSLAGDAEQLGSQTYAEIKSSSAAMLAQLKATKAQLNSLVQQAEGGIGSAQSQVDQGMSALLTRLNNDVLGSTDADVPITAVPVQGCSITLPELAPDAPRTLASAVRLLDAQVGTIVATFDDSSTDNCRETLIEQIRADIGDPAAECVAGSTSIRCAIQEARDGLLTDQQRIDDLKSQLRLQIGQLGASQLSQQASLLAVDLAALRGHVNDLAQALDEHADETIDGIIPELTSASNDAKSRVAAIRAQIAATRPDAPDSVTDELTGLSGQATSLQTTLGDLGQTLADLATDELAGTQTRHDELSTALAPLLTAWDDLTADTPAAQPLPSGWQTTTVTTVTTAMNGDPACAADWADGLSDSSTAAEVIAALTAVAADPACPAAPLAGLLASVVEAQEHNRQGLDQVGTVLSSTVVDTAGISTALGEIGDAVQDMSTTLNTTGSGVRDRLAAAQQALGDQLADPLLAAVTELTTRMDDMSALLDDLYDDTDPAPAADASGFLADVDALIQRIQEAAVSGDLEGAQTALTELTDRLNSTYTGDGSVPQGCASPLPDPGGHPGPSADAVIWLSNQVSCGVQSLDTTLDTWQDEVNAIFDQAGIDLGTAISRTDAAAATATENIDAVSDGLVTGLTEQTRELTQDSLDTIDRVKVDNEADIKAMTGSFRAATDAVVSEMVDQIGSANLDLDATRARLAANFSAVLVNLGSPEGDGRTGLLGKLRSSASLVGDTATVMDDLTDTVAGQAGTLSARVAHARLQTAGLAAAQDRLVGLPAFADAPAGAETLVIYSFRVLGS